MVLCMQVRSPKQRCYNIICLLGAWLHEWQTLEERTAMGHIIISWQCYFGDRTLRSHPESLHSPYTHPTLKGYRSTYNNIINKAWALADILCLLIWQEISYNACLCGSNYFFIPMVQSKCGASMPCPHPFLASLPLHCLVGEGLGAPSLSSSSVSLSLSLGKKT